MKIRFSVLQRLLAGELVTAEFLAGTGARPGAPRERSSEGTILVEADEDSDLRISRVELRALDPRRGLGAGFALTSVLLGRTMPVR